MPLRVPRVQQTLNCDSCSLESNRSRVRISLTRRIPKAQQSPTQRPFIQAPAVRTPAVSSVAHEPVATVPANLVWEPADRDTLLKDTSRQRFTETSGCKIRSFLADAELFFTLCNRPRDRWGFFILSWLGSEEAEKVRRSHIADAVADYCTFREGLVSLVGRFEFEGAYRATLRNLRQSGAESIAAYSVSRKTCARTCILTFRLKTNCRSLSIILSLASLTFRRANTCSESEHAVPSSGKRRFESRRHRKQRAYRTTCIRPLPLSRTLPPFQTQTPCCTLTRPSDPRRRALTRLPRTRVLAPAISNRLRTHPAVNSRVQVLIPGKRSDLRPCKRMRTRTLLATPANPRPTRKQVTLWMREN